ncbi:hypothetical protein FBU30_003342 [Linnemannia zychae]|nr:hypothetical protein FBU30_003342 [Linnemannia zychae]
MRISTALFVTAATLATYVHADMLQINNPTAGTVWTAGVSNFVGWTGNCASMGAAAKNVTVILNTGPSEAVRYVATLGTLDCSGSSTRTDLTVPLTVSSGTYSIVVRTDPQLSYTNMFTINNPAETPAASPAAPSSNGGSTGGSSGGSTSIGSTTTHAAGSGASKSRMDIALVGLGVVALSASQFLL